MEAKYENDKFIVINKDALRYSPIKLQAELATVIRDIMHNDKIATGKDRSDNQYYICNQDEPYAQKVIDTILEGESAK